MRYVLLGSALAAGLAFAGCPAVAADLPVPVATAAATVLPTGYVSVFGGFALQSTVSGHYSDSDPIDVPLNSGYLLGVAVGTHLMPNLRGEVELSYVHHDVTGTFSSSGVNYQDAGSFGATYLLGNLWYDLDMGGGFTPYLGGGLGLGVMMPNVTFPTFSPGDMITTSAVAAAGQLGAGVRFQLADNVTVDLGYRMKGIFNGSLVRSPSDLLSNIHQIDHTVQLGVSIGF